MIKMFHEFKSNLNANFWKWFSSSKMIDNKGNPLVLYHGTFEDFDTFDITKIGYGSGNKGHYGYGFYFSYDRNEAKQYGNIILECYIKIEKPFTGTIDEILKLKELNVGKIDDLIDLSIDINSLKSEINKIDKIGYTLIEYIEKFGYEKGWEKFLETYNTKDAIIDPNDISDILEYTTLNADTDGIPDYVFTLLNSIGVNVNNLKINKGFKYEPSLHWITDLGNRSEEVTEAIIKLGYDGIIYGSEVVVFKPNQIKSVNNNGNYGIHNNSILF